jgi:hypothetical protein
MMGPVPPYVPAQGKKIGKTVQKMNRQPEVLPGQLSGHLRTEFLDVQRVERFVEDLVDPELFQGAARRPPA